MYNNQRVWITGASSGIGQALAIQFAEQGAHVILSARRLPQLEQVRQSLKHPERHHCVAMDITDEKQVAQIVAQVFTTIGTIDVLINNAGLSQRALITDTTMATERKIMEVDYFAQVHLTKQILPYLVQQKSAQIVFISSVAGLLGTQYRASYSAAKAAIHMWANSCRAEYADQGISVSVIFPGFVQTNVSFNALNGKGEAQQHQDEAIAQGLAANDFARQAVKALAVKKEYIVIGGHKEKLGVAVSRLSPQFLYKMIRKAKVK
ncbi:SDR family oxidoreductase [Acinetobacter qingfengensis]|uniref:Oxidoreductase n=1 Tax=Acinetobacter qingfengensis TaxID=1262585 RepID=A0A1E7RF90_9GAMM|nr:SDR family oxidoreductase [Acinetobacter qingfengensis]KAA8731885.1 SDR family oxidoreductase [Acinetobacter qingfengensis]OEY97991.1 oxidoreductase [Acinetobacter qingfengensis]